MPPQRFALPSEVPGLAARRIAADILDGVLHKHRTLDEQLDGAAAHPGLKSLSDRDRALMRRLVATILRRLGTLGHVLSRLLDRGIPTDAPRAQSALLIGAAQILWMDVPDHAAVDLSVRLVQSDRRAAKYAGLVNAVLRRCAREGQPLIDEVKAQTLDVPPWLLARWIAHYGDSVARDIAIAISHEPSLDITVKADAAQWATRLHGETLPTGTVRTLLQGSVTMLPGFTEGQWWVQDAAAALPARLFGDVAGKSIADLCAAPGGKTALMSPRSTVRRAAWRGCATIFRGLRWKPKPWWPMPRIGRAEPTGEASTASWSTRPAARPAPSAGIPTSPGCGRKAISAP
jgi:16S rRNA (cytosine967-C5)-methyltransferase